MRLLASALMLASLATPASGSDLPLIRLEGAARYRAVGRCFTATGGVPAALAPGVAAAARKSDPFFRMRTDRRRGTVNVTFVYDPNVGTCEFQVTEPRGDAGGHALVLDGRCVPFPPGAPTPLAIVQEPRRRRELFPFILTDLYGFGSVNGYLVWPPGALPAFSSEPLGFSAHFVYTKSYVPPSPVAWPSRWHFNRRAPAGNPCIYRGTLRLGSVPLF